MHRSTKRDSDSAQCGGPKWLQHAHDLQDIEPFLHEHQGSKHMTAKPGHDKYKDIQGWPQVDESGNKSWNQRKPCMQGIIHCGICPTSVLRRDDKSVCLCDLSHSFDMRDENQQTPCQKGGHLDYSPPEVILADAEMALGDFESHESRTRSITPAADVWQVSYSTGILWCLGQCAATLEEYENWCF